MPGTVKSLSSVLPSIQAPRIKRKHLRKYSWLPDVLRLKGSIISRILGPVLTVTLWAALVCYAKTHGYEIISANSIVPLLSVVVGLILVFRNGTSYERYWEGRKAFASMVTITRNMSRMIWINTAVPPPAETQPADIKGKTPITHVTETQLRRRKIDTLKLCLSFVYATKHYLRGEDGFNYADLQSVLPASFIRHYGGHTGTGYGGTQRSNTIATSFGNGESLENSRDNSISGRDTPESRPDATKRIRVKRSKQQLQDSTTPLLSDSHRTIDFQSFSDDISLPLPLLISHELSRTIFGFRRDGFLETVGPAGLNGITQMISGLVEQLTAMERIANTPIPASYGIHLKQCVTLYLFALPTTLVRDLGWATIPVVTMVAFTFMGIEGIADEIEMPFGTDDRDLPLDRYCQDLKEEIYYIIERLPEGGEGRHGYDDGEGDD
ncbi:Bestrophin, RFP-TM, chloride channel-domain-containing protein [Panaeolus papilionaceus]|nr:Bestrophin, RFP-TM, chloride channel-domain-containing protein [Panaeolus papilionaceus]